MIPKRITVKLFLQSPNDLNLDDLVTVFHSWIQNGTVEGLLIDVADYQHVKNGPGVILIGDQLDYALDMKGGRPGLLLRRKYRGESALSRQYRLCEALICALQASQLLELDPTLKGRVVFRHDEIQIAFPDRLSAPNIPATFAEYSPDITAVLERIVARSSTELRPVSSDPGEAFAVNIHVTEALDLARSIENLASAREAFQVDAQPRSLP